MTEATTLDHRMRLCRVWVLGGILLLGYVLIGLALPMMAGTATVTRIAFAAATVLFAIGWRGVGSVTARRPLGTVALILLGVWPWVMDLLWLVFPATPSSLAAMPIVPVGTVVQLLVAIVAVTQIARAGVVPQPWSWTPTIALVMVVLAQVLMMAFASISHDQTALVAAMDVAALAQAVAVAGVGVVAIVLATRAEPGGRG
ncbi:hypothetical protein JOD62_001678 [Microbacterium keratanolyticum]|nr:hypothetical protein [Microbacterium keratanolyticum]MBM7469130.1 hypothetical protein [Microbacterium keratanolyticum]